MSFLAPIAGGLLGGKASGKGAQSAANQQTQAAQQAFQQATGYLSDQQAAQRGAIAGIADQSGNPLFSAAATATPTPVNPQASANFGGGSIGEKGWSPPGGFSTPNAFTAPDIMPRSPSGGLAVAPTPAPPTATSPPPTNARTAPAIVAQAPATPQVTPGELQWLATASDPYAGGPSMVR